MSWLSSAMQSGNATMSNGLSGMTSGLTGGATPQSTSTATNIASGAQNGGNIGSLAKDINAGNYGSAFGNALQLGQNSAQSNKAPVMSAAPAQIPQTGNYAPQQLNSPMLDRFRSQYGG